MATASCWTGSSRGMARAGQPFPTGYPPEEEQALFALLRRAVAQHRQEEVAGSTGLDGDVEILLATMHGLISGSLSGRVDGDGERGLRLLKRAIRTLLDQWENSRRFSGR